MSTTTENTDLHLSHLDEDGKAMVQDTLIALNKQGITIVMVEHDLQTATFAERKRIYHRFYLS